MACDILAAFDKQAAEMAPLSPEEAEAVRAVRVVLRTAHRLTQRQGAGGMADTMQRVFPR